MNRHPLQDVVTFNAQATGPPSLEHHFGGADGLLPLWIAEPYITIAPATTAAIEARASVGWSGYESRPEALADLETKAAEPTTTALILCNPHNPVGRVWSSTELSEVATIRGLHGVFVIADAIHADRRQ